MAIIQIAESLVKLYNYEIKDFKIDANTIEFYYISIVRNIKCQCKITTDNISINVASDEIIRHISELDNMLGINKIIEITDYINNSIGTKSLHVMSDHCSIDVNYEHTRINVIKLERIIEILDILLLNIINRIASNILHNRERFINEQVIVYPGIRYKKFVNTEYLVNDRDSYYHLNVDNCRYNICRPYPHPSGYLRSKSAMIDLSDDELHQVTLLVYNNTLKEVISELKKINIDSNVNLELDGTKISLACDKPIKLGYLHKNNSVNFIDITNKVQLWNINTFDKDKDNVKDTIYILDKCVIKLE